jgi:hypothetical protein
MTRFQNCFLRTVLGKFAKLKDKDEMLHSGQFGYQKSLDLHEKSLDL